jgi:hypothetical protein
MNKHKILLFVLCLYLQEGKGLGILFMAREELHISFFCMASYSGPLQDEIDIEII